jgi:rhomboid protease GluP
MNTDNANLEARSQAQALDWSLVLISQGIESTVLRRVEDGAWIVEVADTDSSRAAESIAAYERENATVWRRELKWTGLLFDSRVMVWYMALALFFWFVTQAHTDFETAGMMVRSAVLHGEWWRLFTAVTLHADIAHLAANVTTGIVFTGLAMGCFGAGNALLLSFFGGALGNVASLALHNDPFQSLGASGMVMASLGLIAAHSLIVARNERPALLMGRGLIAGCLLVVLLGLSPKSDVIAHLGGFIAGVGLGLLAMRFRNMFLRRATNIVCAVGFVALVIVTWLPALR